MCGGVWRAAGTGDCLTGPEAHEKGARDCLTTGPARAVKRKKEKDQREKEQN